MSIFLILSLMATPSAGPTEASLLAAWEAAQRADPDTVCLESIGERRYRFETTRFPYAGELVVTNLDIDEGFEAAGERLPMGVVEVELPDADVDALARTHALTFGRWQGNNVLYWSDTQGRWLTGREWQHTITAAVGQEAGWSAFLSRHLFWLLLLVLLLALLVPLWRTANRNMASAMKAQEKVLAEQARSLELVEDSIAIAEDSNRTLHAILEEIRRPGSGGACEPRAPRPS